MSDSRDGGGKGCGEQIGPQVVVSDARVESRVDFSDNLGNAPGRDAVLIPFAERARAHAHKSRKGDLRAAKPVTPAQGSVHNRGFLHPKLKVNNPLPVVPVDRNRYYSPMVKTLKLPTPRPPSEFATFAEWIKEICDSTPGAAVFIAGATGVTPATVSHWRAGKVPRPDKLKKLAIVFGVSEDDLVLLAARSAKTIERAPRPTDDPLTAEMMIHWRRLTSETMQRAGIEMLRVLGELSTSPAGTDMASAAGGAEHRAEVG